MDSTDDLIAAFKALFAAQPQLASRLRCDNDLGSAAEVLARIGAENGIAVNAAEIRRYVRSMLHSGAQADRSHELPDDALDMVAAGSSIDPGSALLMELLIPPAGAAGGLSGRSRPV